MMGILVVKRLTSRRTAVFVVKQLLSDITRFFVGHFANSYEVKIATIAALGTKILLIPVTFPSEIPIFR